MIFRFGAFELDEQSGELRRAGQPVDVQPKPLALLALLVRERERVVPTDEIFETLWPGTAVTPGSLTRAVSHARRAIDDTHRGSSIRSYAKRGYRFCADVVEIDPDHRPAAGSEAVLAVDPVGGEPFVGRSDTLDSLRAAWARVREGRPEVAVVTGPPGIGKTRLTEVFAEEVRRAGACVAIGRCREGDGVPVYWVWVQIIRQLFADETLREALGELPGGLGEFAEFVPEIDAAASPPGGSPDQRRFLFFDGVVQALVRCSRERPIVLIVEDLQWAQPSSLSMLEHLALELDGAILTIATVRDEARERTHPVNRTLATLRRQGCRHHALERFSRGEVATLLAQVLGVKPPGDLTSELVARTEGVPLFVREAIRMLASHGDLDQLDQISRRGIVLPSHALDLIHRTIDGLDEACAALVGAASVIGREFSVPMLAGVAKLTRGDTLDLLDEAVRAGIVETAPDTAATYRFVHALFQEAIYASLPGGERARLHARAASRLEKQHADQLDRVIAELAHHHHHGIAVGDPERAYECAIQAAERAARSFAYEQVAIHFEQAAFALDHTEAVDPERRLETLLALGEAHRVAGERSRRREVLAQAMDTARSLELPDAFARAAIAMCDLTEWSTRDRQAEAAMSEALSRLADENSVERVQLSARLAYLAVHTPKGRPLSEQALSLARDLGDPEALQEALYARHYALAGPEHLEERYALTHEMVDAAARSATHDSTLIALIDCASDCLMRGLAANAGEVRAKAEEVAGRAPPPRLVWHLGVYDTGVALMQGRFDDAAERAREALLVGQRIGHPYAPGVHRTHEAALCRDRGDHEQTVEMISSLTGGQPSGLTLWLGAMVGRSLVAIGDEQAAREQFEHLTPSELAVFDRRIEWLEAVGEVGHLCADLGDTERARSLHDMLAPFERHHVMLPVTISYTGPVAYLLARLRELLARSDESIELYTDAIGYARDIGAEPMIARIERHFGELMARRKDRTRARELFRDSLAIAERLGMQEIAGRARSGLEKLA